MQMSLEEFIEALARAAEKIDIVKTMKVVELEEEDEVNYQFKLQ